MVKTKKETYIISLKENKRNAETYIVDKTLFQSIKKQIAPYKSKQIKPKKLDVLKREEFLIQQVKQVIGLDL